MMFLIRAAFWLSVAILFIPGNPETDSPAPRVTLIEGVVAAGSVVSDVSHFCERNPDVCVTGSAAFQIFAEKAQNGAKLLYRYIDERMDGAADEIDGTLTEDDLQPVWQGSATGSAA